MEIVNLQVIIHQTPLESLREPRLAKLSRCVLYSQGVLSIPNARFARSCLLLLALEGGFLATVFHRLPCSAFDFFMFLPVFSFSPLACLLACFLACLLFAC